MCRRRAKRLAVIHSLTGKAKPTRTRLVFSSSRRTRRHTTKRGTAVGKPPRSRTARHAPAPTAAATEARFAAAANRRALTLPGDAKGDDASGAFASRARRTRRVDACMLVSVLFFAPSPSDPSAPSGALARVSSRGGVFPPPRRRRAALSFSSRGDGAFALSFARTELASAARSRSRSASDAALARVAAARRDPAASASASRAASFASRAATAPSSDALFASANARRSLSASASFDILSNVARDSLRRASPSSDPLFHRAARARRGGLGVGLTDAALQRVLLLRRTREPRLERFRFRLDPFDLHPGLELESVRLATRPTRGGGGLSRIRLGAFHARRRLIRLRARVRELGGARVAQSARLRARGEQRPLHGVALGDERGDAGLERRDAIRGGRMRLGRSGCRCRGRAVLRARRSRRGGGSLHLLLCDGALERLDVVVFPVHVSNARGRACGARGACPRMKENAFTRLFPPDVVRFSFPPRDWKTRTRGSARVTRRRATRVPPSARDDAYRRPRALGGCRCDRG